MVWLKFGQFNRANLSSGTDRSLPPPPPQHYRWGLLALLTQHRRTFFQQSWHYEASPPLFKVLNGAFPFFRVSPPPFPPLPTTLQGRSCADHQAGALVRSPFSFPRKDAQFFRCSSHPQQSQRSCPASFFLLFFFFRIFYVVPSISFAFNPFSSLIKYSESLREIPSVLFCCIILKF